MPRVVILVLTATFALRAGAQPASSERLAAIIAAVPSLETVRLSTAGLRVTGRITERRVDSFTMTAAPSLEARDVRMESVDSLWRFSGPHGRKGASVGAKIGAVAGAAFLARVAYGFGAKPEYFLMSIPAGAAGGAVVGGTLGAAIGVAQNRWRLDYVR